MMTNRLERDGRLPDTVFIQIDGGGEKMLRELFWQCASLSYLEVSPRK